MGVCNVHFYHMLPYSTLVWVGKSAFIAFIIVCVQAPADGKGGAPVVRTVMPGQGHQQSHMHCVQQKPQRMVAAQPLRPGLLRE